MKGQAMLVLSKPELLQELGIVENTLRALIEQRGFPHPRKMGAKLFWLMPEVLAWLQACPRAWGGADDPGDGAQ